MNVLLTACGSPGATTFFSEIKKLLPENHHRIYGCDMANAGSKEYDEVFQCLPGDDPDYAVHILSKCKLYGIDLIIPCSDEEIIAINNNIHMFYAENIFTFMNEVQNIKTIFDKRKLYELLKEKGYSDVIPKYRSFVNSNQIKSQYHYIKSVADQVCIKPSVGHGSRGFRIVVDKLCHREYFTSKLTPKITYDSMVKMFEGENIPEVLVMEYLSGTEYSVDCIDYDGKFVCVIRSRDKIIDGIAAEGTIVKDPQIEEYSRKIYQALGFNSNVNLQYKRNAGGRPFLLEINPRVSGSIAISIAAGPKFIKYGFDKAMRRPLTDKVPDIQHGMKCKKVWELLTS